MVEVVVDLHRDGILSLHFQHPHTAWGNGEPCRENTSGNITKIHVYTPAFLNKKMGKKFRENARTCVHCSALRLRDTAVGVVTSNL